jgi:hypothetical protein
MGNAAPGIAWRALIVVHTHHAVRELHRVGLADERHPGRGEAPHRFGVVARDPVLEEMRSTRARLVPNVEQLLGRVGNSLERARIHARAERGLRCPGLPEGAIPREPQERMERGVDRVDAREAPLDEGGRRDRSAPEGGADLANGAEG